MARVFPIDGPWPGRLAILPRPRGGDWLADDVGALKDTGLDVVVSTLESDESESLGLGAEGAEMERNGLMMVSFPIPDRGTPQSTTEADRVIRQLWSMMNEGKFIGIHCRQGIGRSTLVAAALLINAGVRPADAWRRIELARGCPVPETEEQRNWSDRFTRTDRAEQLVKES